MWNSSIERAAYRKRRSLGVRLAASFVAGVSALVLAVPALATANAWTSVSPMPGGSRDRMAVATGTDGRIYAIGGYDGTNMLDRVEAYDPRTNTWATEAPMPGGGRCELAAATGPDGRIYAIGGENDSNLLDRVEAYDPSTNTWTTEAPMPGGVRGFLAAATGPDGRIYAIGGYDGSRLDRVEAYDTSTNTWTTMAPMPGGGRSDEGAVTGPDGRIYAIGGSDGTAYIPRVEAYDTNSNTWTTVAPMPAGGRGDLGATLGPDGRIYVIGGANGPGGSGPLDTVEAYNTSSNTWTSGQPIAAGATSFPSAATGPDGRIYTIGGFDGTNYLKRVEAYTTIGGRLTVTDTSITATEGKALSGVKVAGFSDADENTSAGVYSATINWGDAASSSGTVTPDGSGGYTVWGSHTYVEEGTFPVAVQITDLDATTTIATSTATVADATLTAVGLHLTQANDSVSGVVARFSDADLGGVLSDYSAVIKWSDGTITPGVVAASGGGFTVWGTHHYSRDKEWAVIKVVIVDAGGSTATATTIARE
jgi:N-acetylneuraminic acid mutarotase